jgi:hypothetical protein
VKFSFRQILASAAGAVIAALIASSFGVTGTIVGVAIGSMAATLGTALVSQSLERGQKVVKQAAVRVPEGPTSTLLRRMGGTGAAGGTTSSVDDAGAGVAEPEPTEVAGTVGDETTQMKPATAAGVGVGAGATERVEVVPAADVGADEPVTEPFEATTAPLLPTSVLEGAGVVGVTGGAGVATTAATDGAERGRRFTWKAFAGTAAIVFVLALGVVTAVELIANRPTVFTPSSPATTPTSTSTTTTTTSTPSTTTSTSAPTSSTTTSTTGPSSATTSTTVPSTTTTNVKSATTTTTTTTPAGP